MALLRGAPSSSAAIISKMHFIRFSLAPLHTPQRPLAMRGEPLASVVETHSDLVGLSVELALNHPLVGALVEFMRGIQEILGVEIRAPVHGKCIGGAEVHGR